MRWFFCCLIVLFTCCAQAQDSVYNAEIATALKLVNKARKDAGLDTVRLSVTISEGCLKHAKYLVINKGHKLTQGLGAHSESKTLKGYSVEGEVAGRSSVIHFVLPSLAIDGWLRTFYHRIPLLQPGLKEIGIAYYEQDGYTVCLLNCITGTERAPNRDVVYYPNDGQRAVPLQMGPEIPHPAPGGNDSSFGFPITIYFASGDNIKNVAFTLADKNKHSIACYISTPEKPATSFTQWNTVCAIPKKPLTPATQYFVIFSCIVDGVAFKKSYSFYTGKSD